jgi:hypothetical protein
MTPHQVLGDHPFHRRSVTVPIDEMRFHSSEFAGGVSIATIQNLSAQKNNGVLKAVRLDVVGQFLEFGFV